MPVEEDAVDALSDLLVRALILADDGSQSLVAAHIQHALDILAETGCQLQ
jgi:hypothetical protein